MTVYLDTSALVKLVVIEKESRALRTFLRHEPEQFSCAIARTELLRAVHRGGSAAIEDAAALIAPELTALVTYDKRMVEGAAVLGFPVVSPA